MTDTESGHNHHGGPKFSYPVSWVIMILAYVISFIAVIFSYRGLMHTDINLLLITLILDLIFTTVIFIFCVLSRSSSVYDPMWGFAPLPLVFFWSFLSDYYDTAKNIIVIIVVGIYFARHMFIFFRGWPGLQFEDFRYIKLAKDLEKFKQASFIFLYFGYYAVPSVMVLLGMVPVYYITQATKIENGAFYVGIVVCISGILLSHIADQQLKNYRERNSGDSGNSKGYIDEGLWRYSRHPNYLGEIMMWWGLYIMCVGTDGVKTWTWVGALVVFVLFEFGTITMMEKHLLERRPGYAVQQRRVNRLMFWFRNENATDENMVTNKTENTPY